MRFGVLAVSLIAALMCTTAPIAAKAEPSVRDIMVKVDRAYAKLHDLQAEIKVSYCDDDELRKIGNDFARSFGFKNIGISFKPPDKLRYESMHVSFAKVVAITVGNTKAIRIPSLRLSRKSTMAKAELGKKQYPIDFGIAWGDLWSDWRAQYLRMENAEGEPCYVVKLTNPAAGRETVHLEVWIDRSLGIPRRVLRVRPDGQIKSRMCFKQFRLIDNVVLIPKRIEVYNKDSKLAGVLEYVTFRVNHGLPDSDFRM